MQERFCNHRAMRPPRVTIRDVARHAGVSTTTVSDALNERGRLPVETRRRVARSAERLGYRPNPTARRLRAGRSGHVGLYCPFLPGLPGGFSATGYYMEVAMGAAGAAIGHDVGLVLLPPGLSPARLADTEVDGLLIADPVCDDPGVAALAARRLPIVTIERDLSAGRVHAGVVESDHATALHDLLDHLAERGAARPALIAPGPETAWGVALAAAYGAWCARRGVEPLLERGPAGPEPGYVERATQALLAAPRLPDAIVCAPDGGAARVVRILAREGIAVPGEMLVASCVEGAPMAACEVPVTSIDLQPGLAGTRAAALLLEVLEGGAAPERVEVLPTRLIVRASTTPTATLEP
jgi:DNA-binding LacI/PurR family transcriptional regulator